MKIWRKQKLDFSRKIENDFRLRYNISRLVRELGMSRGAIRTERNGIHCFGKYSKIFGIYKWFPILIPKFRKFQNHFWFGIFRFFEIYLNRNFLEYFGYEVTFWSNGYKWSTNRSNGLCLQSENAHNFFFF